MSVWTYQAAAAVMVPPYKCDTRKRISACTHDADGNIKAISIRDGLRVTVFDGNDGSILGFAMGDDRHMTVFNAKFDLLGSVSRDATERLQSWIMGSIKSCVSEESFFRVLHFDCWGAYIGFSVLHANDNAHLSCRPKAVGF